MAAVNNNGSSANQAWQAMQPTIDADKTAYTQDKAAWKASQATGTYEGKTTQQWQDATVGDFQKLHNDDISYHQEKQQSDVDAKAWAQGNADAAANGGQVDGHDQAYWEGQAQQYGTWADQEQGAINYVNASTWNTDMGDNVGDGDTGHHNVGFDNSGNDNVGNDNSGDRNLGDGNSGSDNNGNFNVGDRNQGNFNLGNDNNGTLNLGNRNNGNLNLTDANNGNLGGVKPS